jgi:hypothetical protein
MSPDTTSSISTFRGGAVPCAHELCTRNCFPRKEAARKSNGSISRPGLRVRYFLKASLTFSPASLRLDFAWSFLPSF